MVCLAKASWMNISPGLTQTEAMSSKRRLRRRQCTHKRRFSSKKEAKDFIRYLRLKGVCRNDTHPYRCQFCNGWHIGRSSRNLQRRESIKVWEWNS